MLLQITLKSSQNVNYKGFIIHAVDGNPGTIFNQYIGSFSNILSDHKYLGCGSGNRDAVTHTTNRVNSARSSDTFTWSSSTKPTSGFVTFYAVVVQTIDYWVGQESKILFTIQYNDTETTSTTNIAPTKSSSTVTSTPSLSASSSVLTNTLTSTSFITISSSQTSTVFSSTSAITTNSTSQKVIFTSITTQSSTKSANFMTSFSSQETKSPGTDQANSLTSSKLSTDLLTPMPSQIQALNRGCTLKKLAEWLAINSLALLYILINSA
jgi:hypothetical protein